MVNDLRSGAATRHRSGELGAPGMAAARTGGWREGAVGGGHGTLDHAVSVGEIASRAGGGRRAARRAQRKNLVGSGCDLDGKQYTHCCTLGGSGELVNGQRADGHGDLQWRNSDQHICL